MSSSDDSATEEFDREQELRGTQSRKRQPSSNNGYKGPEVVDTNVAKQHVNQEIEKAKTTIEIMRKDIARTQLDIIKLGKSIDAIKNHIQVLEQNNSIFKELGSFGISNELLEFLEKNRSRISKLPHDQKEMLHLLEEKARDTQLPMAVDDQ